MTEEIKLLFVTQSLGEEAWQELISIVKRNLMSKHSSKHVPHWKQTEPTSDRKNNSCLSRNTYLVVEVTWQVTQYLFGSWGDMTSVTASSASEGARNQNEACFEVQVKFSQHAELKRITFVLSSISLIFICPGML